MERRELLLGGLSGLALPVANLVENVAEKQNGKFLVVIHLWVSNMSPASAVLFVEKYSKMLAEKKPDHINFLLLPQRGTPTNVEVFSLGDENAQIDKEWFEANFKDIEPIYANRNMRINSVDEILEYSKLMAGAPTKELHPNFDEFVLAMIDKGRIYRIINLKAYVGDLAMDEDNISRWRGKMIDQFKEDVSLEIDQIAKENGSVEEMKTSITKYIEEYCEGSRALSDYKQYMLEKAHHYIDIIKAVT